MVVSIVVVGDVLIVSSSMMTWWQCTTNQINPQLLRNRDLELDQINRPADRIDSLVNQNIDSHWVAIVTIIIAAIPIPIAAIAIPGPVDAITFPMSIGLMVWLFVIEEHLFIVVSMAMWLSLTLISDCSS